MAKATRRSQSRGRPFRRSRVRSRLNSRARSRVGLRLNSQERLRTRVSKKKKRGKKRSKKVGGDGTGLSIRESIHINISDLKEFDWLDATNGYTLNTLFGTILGGIINIEDNKNIFPTIPYFPENEIFNEIPSIVHDKRDKVNVKFKIGGNQFKLKIKEDTSNNKIIIHILRENGGEVLYNNTITSIEITKPETAPEPALDNYRTYFLQITEDIKAGKFNGASPNGKKARLIRWDRQDKSTEITEPKRSNYDMVDLKDGDRYYFIKNLNDEEVKRGTKNLVSYYHPTKGWFHFKKMIN